MAKLELRPDIQNEFKHLTEYLWEGETVEMACGGTYGNGQGLLVLTNLRLLFVQHGIMSQKTEDFPLDRVSSVQWSSGMVQGTLTIFASGNKAEVKNVEKSAGKALADRVRAIISGAHSAAAAAAPVAYAATSAPPPPPSVPAGWYPDPQGAPVQRYWDGGAWTEHTAPLAP
jgi:hypothetical protein